MEKTSKPRITTAEIYGLKTAWMHVPANQPGADIALFLHGCPDAPSIWRKQFDHFGGRYEIVAPFARGLDPSEPSEDRSRYGLDSIAHDLMEILRRVDSEQSKKVTLIAHDLGGPQAWRLAPLLGDRLEAMILINAPAISQMAQRYRNPRQLWKSWYVGAFQLPGVAERLIGRDEAKWVRSAYQKGGFTEEEASLLEGRILPFLPHYRSYFRSIPKEVGKRGKTKVQAPVLSLWGDEDAFLEPATRGELESLAERFEIEILDGNHWIQFQQADRINSLIDRYLARKQETAHAA